MDNLDISDSLSSSFPWLPYGASQFSDYHVNGELSYFGQRTAMLEPIIEETSDDDDVSCGHVWTHNDNQWSSESDAGSVIRVELIQGKHLKFRAILTCYRSLDVFIIVALFASSNVNHTIHKRFRDVSNVPFQ